MVAMFFFCSGFGLYKSAKAKPDFFKRFIPSRIIPILMPMLFTAPVYAFFRYWRKVPHTFNPPFQINSHDTWHPSVWFIPCIIIMYILFYIGFGLLKKDWLGILVVLLGTAAYIILGIKYRYGTWWLNTAHMFLIGILAAKYEKKFRS